MAEQKPNPPPPGPIEVEAMALRLEERAATKRDQARERAESVFRQELAEAAMLEERAARLRTEPQKY